jgi:hypothetical protein
MRSSHTNFIHAPTSGLLTVTIFGHFSLVFHVIFSSFLLPGESEEIQVGCKNEEKMR